MPEEYMTMEEAIRELGVSEEEIKKLITEGKLRSFRDGTLIKFRASDIHALSGKTPAKEEGELIPLAEEPKPEAGKPAEEEEPLESIFGDTEQFDIAPLEEEEAAVRPAEAAPETVEEVPEEAAPEEVELGEEAVEEITPLPEEVKEGVEEEVLEEIEEKGAELEREERKKLEPGKVRVALGPSYTAYTVLLVVSFLALIVAGFAIVNTVVTPGSVHSILKPISDAFLNLVR